MNRYQDKNSNILMGRGAISYLLELLKEKKNLKQIFLLYDKNLPSSIINTVEKIIYSLNITTLSMCIKANEENKNLSNVEKIWEFLSTHKVDRKSLLINLGGGVLCDMGGFVASTYKRGIEFINIPTTLLAMIDASVGGKTAINLGSTKNIIGTFAHAEAVIIDTNFTNTLSDKELYSGFAEILKMYLIRSREVDVKNLFEILVKKDLPDYIIGFCIEQKAKIVEADFKEENIRKILNFGHTFGHAFEALALKKQRIIPHGYAVAYGMVCELYLSCKKLGFNINIFTEIKGLIEKYYVKFEFKKNDIEDILNFILNDKKNECGYVYPILLNKIGSAHYNISIDNEDIVNTLNFYKGEF